MPGAEPLRGGLLPVRAASKARLLLGALRGEIHAVPWAWSAEGPRERGEPGFVHDRVMRELARG